MISSLLTSSPGRLASRIRSSIGIRSSFSSEPDRRNRWLRTSSSNSPNCRTLEFRGAPIVPPVSRQCPGLESTRTHCERKIQVSTDYLHCQQNQPHRKICVIDAAQVVPTE